MACPKKVQSALSKVDGVISSNVTMTSAAVVVDRNKVTNAELLAAVRSAGDGFNGTVK